MSASPGAWKLQCFGQRGWKTLHHAIDLKDPAAYVERLNKRPGTHARVISNETGEIIGDQTACGLCGDPHDGVEGSCLL